MTDETATEPIRNWTWEAMTQADQAALRPHARRKHLPHGDVLMRAGDEVDVVYFPVTADIANVVRLPDGAEGLATTVGRDGVTGLAAFLANEPLGWELKVQVEGDAWSLPANILRRRQKESPALSDLLMALTHANQVEGAWNAVCNAHHHATPRLARWLLTTQDRTSLSEFQITQDELALKLGLLRTTVVASCKTLVEQEAISTGRGRIRIISRPLMKRLACACYTAARS